jgi:hypothetical protein
MILRFVAASLAVLLLATVVPGGDESAPLALHPDNPRYFLFRGKPAVLVTSGEHYGAVLNRDVDYVRYLDALAADGLNHTRTFSGVYREVAGSFGITENTLAPKPDRYAAPWARSETPGALDGESKFDLETWDESYFRRLKDFVTQASERGIVVEMNLFCPLYQEEMWEVSPMNAPNNVNGVGAVGRDEVYTLAHDDLTAVQERLARKIVTELNPFDNLYFEITNEPYQGTVTREFEDRIAQVVAEAEAGLPNRHLISMNIANRSKVIENPNPLVSIFNFHYAIPPEAVAMNGHVRGVIGDNETGFEGREDVLYRSEGWAFLMAGGGLYSSLDYSFTVAHPDGTFLGYESPGGGSPALRGQLGILKRFVEGFDYVHMAPDRAVVSGLPAGLEAWALVEPGQQYAAYVLERVGGRSFAARWTARLDPPATGEYTFTTVSDDGVRLWIDDRLVVENWTDHGSTADSGRVKLSAGEPVTLRLDFYQGRGGAEARLRWTLPDGVTEVVPSDRLSVAGDGAPGLKAEYFEGPVPEGEPALVRTEATVDFEWEVGESPLPPRPRWSGPATFTLDLPEGLYRAEWIDTRTGEVAKSEDLEHSGGPRTVVSPPFEEDVALAVRANPVLFEDEAHGRQARDLRRDRSR